MEQIRSFIAVELDQTLKWELAGIQSRLQNPPRPWVKWVNPENIHITLKFLGDIAADKVEAIKEVMRQAASGVAPFTLKAEGLGVFPNDRKPQVIWVGLSGETQRLAELQEKLEKRLEAIGFAAESRPFSAHLTLGRVRREALPQQRQDIGRLAATMGCCASSQIAVDAICLMESQLTPGGAIYSRLAVAPLLG